MRTSTLALLLAIFVLPSIGKASILIDYGQEGSAPDLGGHWNTFENPTGASLLDSSSAATGINISFGTGIEAVLTQGTWSFGDTDWIDADATADGFFARTRDSSATVTFSGLDAGSTWRFDHVALRNRSASARVADYTVNGVFADSTPNGNDFNARTDGWDAGHYLTWNSVVADQNGQITLVVNVVSSFGYLNASRLTKVNAVPEPATIIIWSFGAIGMTCCRRR